MRTAIFTTAALVLLASAAHAGMIAVDFEGFDVDGEQQMHPGVVAGGMIFTDPRAEHGELHLVDDGGCLVGCAASGSLSLLYEGIHPTQPGMHLKHPAGLPFRVLGFDASEAFFDSKSQSAAGILLRGHLAAGGIIEATVTLDGVVDGQGGAADFESFTLESAFADEAMTLVEFWGVRSPNGSLTSRAGFQLDDVSIFVEGDHVAFDAVNVPEPNLISLVAGVALVVMARNRKSRFGS